MRSILKKFDEGVWLRLAENKYKALARLTKQVFYIDEKYQKLGLAVDTFLCIQFVNNIYYGSDEVFLLVAVRSGILSESVKFYELTYSGSN